MYLLNEIPGATTPLSLSTPVNGSLKLKTNTGEQPLKAYSKEATTLTRTYPQPRKFQRKEGRAPFY